MSLFVRSCVVWVLILGVAVLNGAVRQKILIPAIGEHEAHVVSTLLLSLSVLVCGYLTAAWLDMATAREAWMVGLVWLVLTVAFEFVGGHFLFGAPWSQLLADYNL